MQIAEGAFLEKRPTNHDDTGQTWTFTVNKTLTKAYDPTLKTKWI